MDEYKEVQKEMNQIIDKRLQATSLNHQWNYNREVGKLMQQQPFKYHKVDMSTNVEFTDDIRKLIYNEKEFPQDIKVFNSTEWQLAPITQSSISAPSSIPSGSYVRAKKPDTKQVDYFFGKIQLEGRLKGKSNEINYNNYHFNLRSNALVLYRSEQVDAGEKQLFYVNLNERTFDYQSDATDYLYLKGDEKNFKVLKDDWSKELITRLERRLLFFSFRGAYAFRNQIPDWKIQDYINGEIDTIGPINFQHQNAIRDIVGTKAYRETVGAFLKLLERVSRKRSNKAGQINYPRWLKDQFRDLPQMQTWLSTNVIPPQYSLMSLKVKVNQNEKKGLMHSIKYIFPYLKNYVKRSLTIYQSQLNDEDARKILQNTSYPMYSIAFPHNQLSQKALQHAIHKSSDFYNQIIDFSYNKKLLTITGVHMINMINNNPTIKKLCLRGCQVANGEFQKFFDALGSNLCLEEVELDYHENYNESMVQFLDEFDAIFQ